MLSDQLPTDLAITVPVIQNMKKELDRVEECCDYSSQGHFEASKCHGWLHFWLGISASALSALVAACVSYECLSCKSWVVVLAILSSVIAAIITFLRPCEHSENHRVFGNQYLALRNQCRRFREIEMEMHSDIPQQIVEKFEILTQKYDELNCAAPTIPKKHYLKARKNISGGCTTHKVDQIDTRKKT